MKYTYTRKDIAMALKFEDVMLKDGRPAMRVTIETICGGAIMFAVGYVCIMMPLAMMRG